MQKKKIIKLLVKKLYNRANIVAANSEELAKKAAERSWDPPLEERFPAKFDIVLGLVGGFFSIRERFANKAF